jgi:hypothetical protein
MYINGVSVDPVQFETNLLRAGVEWLGHHYEYGGHGQGEDGIDCSGLVVEIFKDMGWEIADRSSEDFFNEIFTLRSPPFAGPVIKAWFGDSVGTKTHIAIEVTPRVVIHSTDQEDWVSDNGENDGVMMTNITRFHTIANQVFTEVVVRWLDIGKLRAALV